jgi:hypothetical protein
VAPLSPSPDSVEGEFPFFLQSAGVKIGIGFVAAMIEACFVLFYIIILT